MPLWRHQVDHRRHQVVTGSHAPSMGMTSSSPCVLTQVYTRHMSTVTLDASLPYLLKPACLRHARRHRAPMQHSLQFHGANVRTGGLGSFNKQSCRVLCPQTLSRRRAIVCCSVQSVHVIHRDHARACRMIPSVPSWHPNSILRYDTRVIARDGEQAPVCPCCWHRVVSSGSAFPSYIRSYRS